MLLNYRKRHLRYILEDIFALFVLLFIIPAVFYCEVYIILPLITEKWSVAYYVHKFNAIFIITNILGNLFFGVFTDTSVNKIRNVKSDISWPFCGLCKTAQPPGTWHCDHCNLCILKRDHHCTIWGCCVGYYNRRYFIGFTFHIFLAMIYCSFFNIKFLAGLLNWNYSIWIKFACPLISLIREPSLEIMFIFSIVLNGLLTMLTGSLFAFHLTNVIEGKIVRDRLENPPHTKSSPWKSNLANVLGRRWYLIVICPCIYSPLPNSDINTFEKNV